jgi:type I restriction enzyme S subunit
MIETIFKDTEVGRIPEDWEVKPLADIGYFSKGAGISRAEAFSGNIPAIRYGEIYTCHNDYIKSFYSFISQSVAESSVQIFNGDILFAASGETKEEIGKSVAYTENETAFSGGDIIILHSDTEKFDAKFCGYALNAKYVIKQKAQRGQGDAVVHIVPRDLATILFAFPKEKSEQTRIATALSNIDALISELSRLIEKKRAIKQGVMQQLLTGKKRLKGFNEPWVAKKLGEICEFQNGYTPSKAVNSFWENGTIPWFRMEDIRTNGRILSDAIQHITEEAVKGNLFPANSIIMSTTATIGEHALLIVDSLANQQFTNLIIRKSLTQAVDVMWFYHYCFILGEWCRCNINEGGLAAVNMEDFSKVTIAVPRINEQNAIASVLTSMDKEISALEAKKAKFEQIKQGMMQQLLTGKIRLVETAVKTNTTSANVHFRRSVLAAEIAERLYEEPTFGHVKMEKMLFLTERLCHIDIGSHYHRDAAGPYDNRALRSIDSQLKKHKWFEVRRTEKRNRYVPMQNCGNHKTYFDKYFSAVLPTFDKIIETFKTQNTERCEIVATLYSAWEDLQHSNKSFTDADIVNEVLNNWHESKKRISQDRWLSAIQWMRENGFAPNV